MKAIHKRCGTQAVMFRSCYQYTIADPIFVCPKCASAWTWFGNKETKKLNEFEIKVHGIEGIVNEYKSRQTST